MKSVFSLCLLALSTQLSAADPEYFTAVLKGSHIQELVARGYAQHIKSVVHDMTNTYRCLGCYDIDVTIINPADEEEVLHFQTELRDMNKIEVRRK